MNVKLIAHTQLSEDFLSQFLSECGTEYRTLTDATGGQAVALTAIRTCYSANKPTEIIAKEGAKYFGNTATDGEGGTEADRLIRHIVRSRHLSTLEHVTFTFAIEDVSRALLAQLTRHRVGFSFSVQSQRYCKFGSNDRTGGFDYVTPPSISGNESKVPSNDDEDHYVELEVADIYESAMWEAQYAYDRLRKAGISAEDARMVLPNAATCNIVMTANLRSLLDFYGKRKKGRGAQAEIADLAENLRKEVGKVEPWVGRFFDEA